MTAARFGTASASSRQTRGVNHTELVNLVRQYLAARGAYEVKVLGGIGQRAGIADVLACLRGRFLACEVKTGSAVLTPKQRAEGHRVADAGGIFVEVRHLEELEDVLLHHGLIEHPALLVRQTAQNRHVAPTTR